MDDESDIIPDSDSDNFDSDYYYEGKSETDDSKSISSKGIM